MNKIQISTAKRQHFVDVTAQIAQLVRQSGIKNGICSLFCPHTTAAITFNENWDPDVQHDLGFALDKISPAYAEFRHSEGNSSAHVKASLLGSDHSVFIDNGELLLGRWQGIYLAEFDGPRNRTLYVKLVSD